VTSSRAGGIGAQPGFVPVVRRTRPPGSYGAAARCPLKIVDACRGSAHVAGVHWLNRRRVNFSLVALLALASGVPIGRVPVSAFFRKILPAQVTAFTTQSNVGTLPVTTSRLTREVGVHPEVAHFTAPLGTTIGMPGCAGIWPVLVAVWGSTRTGSADYLVLAVLAVVVSIGTAGVPAAATVAAATVLSAAGLPLEFVAVTARGRTSPAAAPSGR
jgi:sodium:dicarboxylate symporter family protein